MWRRLLILLLALVVAAAATVAIGWHLLQNEDFLKPRLAAFVLRETGRELAMDGPLRVHLGRETRIEASDLRLANAAWAEEPDMARIGRLVLALDTPSLFGETPVISLVSVEDCSLSLVEREDGTSNWEGLVAIAEEEPEAAESESVPLVVLDAQIRNCQLSHIASTRAQPLRLEIKELLQSLGEDHRWQISGSANVNGDPLQIRGWLGPTDSLVLGGPLEHDLEIRLGQISLDSSGTLQDAQTGQGADIKVRFQGPDITAILAYLDLPAASTGAFDFRLSLDTEGQTSRLEIDGDLGSIQARARGELDRLLQPTRGRVTGTLEGPDLALLGAALGAEGLAASPYSLEAEVGFEPGLVRFDLFELKMPGDYLSLVGALGSKETLAGTDVDVVASSDEIGRWARTLGLPEAELGPVALRGRLRSDAGGRASLTARLEYVRNTITLVGDLGPLAGPFEPDLNVDFHSDDLESLAPLLGDVNLPRAPLSARGHVAWRKERMSLDGLELNLGGHQARLDGQLNTSAPHIGSELELRVSSLNAADLGSLFGVERMPAAPFTLNGHIGRPDQRISIQELVLDLAGHRIEVSGFLNPEGKFSGSDIEARLTSPDLASLAALFGREGMPPQPLVLSGKLNAEDPGIRFDVRHAELGEIRLSAKGHIPDLDNPLGIDADFDVKLPSLTLIAFAAPDFDLPDLPFSASGRLHNHPDRTAMENVRLALGELEATVSGDVFLDERFQLAVAASGADASGLEPYLGQVSAARPFSLSARLQGNTTDFEIADIAASLGESRVQGDLQVLPGTRTRISGRLDAPFLDFSHWRSGDEEAEPPASEPSSAFVFDDTEVIRLQDYGVELDLALSAARMDLGNTLIRDIELGVLFTQDHFELSPFSLTREGSGTLYGSSVLDYSGQKPTLEAEVSGKGLRLGLMVAEDQGIETYPATDIELSLHGVGHTRREMASSLNGKLRISAGPGQVASSAVDVLFSDFLTELFEALDPFAEKSKYTQIECTVVAADIVDGRVKVQPVVFHTEDVTVFSGGDIDLRSEKINLSFNTKPRKGLGITPGTVINTLIKVGGTLKRPTIELDPAGAIVGGGTAIATAGLSIVAKSFADRFLSSKDPCGDARKEIEEGEPQG
jgi:uncharacterized protein involved in outer membrane biogenesis